MGVGVGTLVGFETFAGVGAGSELGGLAGFAVATAAGLCFGLSEAVGDSVGIGVEVGAKVSETGVGPAQAIRAARKTRNGVTRSFATLGSCGSGYRSG